MNDRLQRITFHAGLAGAFFFVLQRFALGQSLDTSLLWAAVLAIAAGLLAWSQDRR